ncbi:NPFFR2 [Mytilus coruscus]|uniref:NPFFR2 n=1 Tax=Mytilus coruscus TaxID=42192 RepID=A0A6J8BIR7_MYTCO|nr:NPFFR2 [Mytilus coruscus]
MALNESNFTFGNEYYEPKEWPLIKHEEFTIVLLCFVYGLIFVTALIGNCLVICVVCKNPGMRNVTNVFIVNLAVADILVTLFCTPLTLLDNIYTGWRFGAFTCKTTPYIHHVSVCASVNTLAAIAIDRYSAICNTWRSKINTCTSRAMISFIWLMAVVLALPIVFFYEKFDGEFDQQTIPMCHQIWPDYDLQRSYYVVGLFIMCYALPLSFIVVCYFSIVYKVWTRRAPGIASNFATINKSKVKVIKMFSIIVSLFAFSRLPLYAVYFQLYFHPPTDVEYVNFISLYIIPVCQWLGLSNCCVNPIIYCFFSRKYRHGFKTLVRCRNCRDNNSFRSIKHHTVTSRCLTNMSTTSHGDSKRPRRQYNPARFMSVQFENGQMTLTFRKDEREDTFSSF